MNLPWAPAGGGRARRVQRLGAVIATTLAVGLLGASSPAARADQPSGLTLTVTQRWKSAANPGSWTAYTITVRNDATGPFDGDVHLVPNTGGNGLPFQSVPRYSAAVSVPRGSARTILVYAMEPAGGYHAELSDGQGRTVAKAIPSAAHSSLTVAVLSDLPQADQQIAGPLTTWGRTDVAVSRFASVQAVPTNAVYLSGLNAIIVDQFDSAALSQPQMQALKDFVGLGGALILTGGGSWRRTLLPVPPELLPLQPAVTAVASLSPLAELAGLTSTLGVQVATGDVPSWAKVSVASPDGQPLIVEGSYGAGRVVALTFDPLSEPLGTQLNLAGLVWSQAISRGLSGAQGPAPYVSQIGLGTAIVGAPVNTIGGSGPGSWSAFPENLHQILGNDANGLSPPFGLLAILLVVYGLLVTVLSYVVLKRVGRRGLLWIVVPGLAIAFTIGSYEFGFGTRGSDFQLIEVQVHWLGPGGVVETDSVDGVITPRRGDVRLTISPNTLVSTAMVVYGPTTIDEGAEIKVAPRPRVVLANVPVWDLRPVETVTVTHPFSSGLGSAAPIEAHLRLDHGSIKGEVVNHTSWTVRNLQLLSGSGSGARLAAALRPGATVLVDAAVSQNAAPPTGKAVISVQGGTVVQSGLSIAQSTRQALVSLAASRGAGRPGELVIVASTDPVHTLQVEGGSAAPSARAALVEPVHLQSADSLVGIEPVARLVSGYVAAGADQIDAYELDLPPGVTGQVGIISSAMGAPQPSASQVEVYDWNLHTWRTLPPQYATGQAPAPDALTPGETVTGVVRLRVHESGPGQTEILATGVP
jgi:hypothetical protein